MDMWGLCLLLRLCLIFGVSGLIWPEKLLPTFEILMFPWPASYRVIHANGVIAIGSYLIVLFRFVRP